MSQLLRNLLLQARWLYFRLLPVLPAAIVGAVMLLCWEAASSFKLADPALLPPASEVFRSLLELVSDGEFYRHLLATLFLMFRGFVLALCAGIPLGVVMGLKKTVDSALSLYVDFLRALPAAALIPMFMVLFKGELARILVIGLSGSLIIAVACRSGVQAVDPARHEVITIMRFSHLARFRKLVFWEMLPELLVGARIAISITFIVATVLEMLLGARYGLGDLLLNALPTNKPEMYAIILVLGAIGYLLNLIFVALEKTLGRIGVFH